MKKKIDLFVCTKPLQYLNVLNIPLSDNGNMKILAIVQSFYKSAEFSENVCRVDSHWDKVIPFDTVYRVFWFILWHRVRNLYISSDNGTAIGVLYHLKHFNLYMVEEGAATYLDIYMKKSKIRTVLDKCLGVSACWGHSVFLKGVYVYYPKLYKIKKNVSYDVLPFVCSFMETIRSKSDFFLKISSSDDLSFLQVKDSKILVYVTDWEINEDVKSRMVEEMGNYDKVYIKPHPHIKSDTITNPEGIELIRTNLMMEFVFCKWLDNNNKITVYHEGSSAIFYYNSQFESVDFSPNKDSEYNRFVSKREV